MTLHLLIDVLALSVTATFVLYMLGDAIRWQWRQRSLARLSQKGIVHADPARVHRESLAVLDRRVDVRDPEPPASVAGLATGPVAGSGSGAPPKGLGKVNGRRPYLWLVE